MARADNWHASKAGERGGSGMGEDVRMRCRLEESGGRERLDRYLNTSTVLMRPFLQV